MVPTIRTVRSSPTWKPSLRASSATSSAMVSAACLVATTSPDAKIRKPTIDVGSDGDSTHDGDTSSTESESYQFRRSGSEHSESDSSPRTSATTTLTRDILLRMRRSVKAGAPPTGHLKTAPRPETPKTPAKIRGSAPKPLSPVAKAAMQHDAREIRLRAVKAMLNKLTLEKFEDLCPKFLELCDTGEDLDVISTQIFDKAAQQHNFTAMYADLCERLFVHLGGEAGFGRELQWALLRLCRGFFANSLKPLSDDAEEDAKVLHKKRTLGNLRFLGELLCRGMLASTEIFLCADELMKEPLVPLKLEGLAVFLTVLGPAFDRSAWPHRDKLLAIFDRIRGLTSNAAVPCRVQFLLQDLLDLRKAGWKDKKLATRNQGPKTLNEVAAETSRKTVPTAVARPALPCEPKIVEQSKLTDFRAEAAEFVPSFLAPAAVPEPTKPKAKRLINKRIPAPSIASISTAHSLDCSY